MPSADSLAASPALRSQYQQELAAKQAAADAATAAAKQKALAALRADDAAAAASAAKAKADTLAVSNMTYSQADAAGIDHGIVRAAQSYVTNSPEFKTPTPTSTSTPVIVTPTVTPTPTTITTGGGSSSNSGSSSQNTGNASTTIKLATDNLLAFKPPTIDAEATTNMLFQSIGGIEILQYSRSDMVYDIDNQALAYQPLSDLSILQSKYSPKSLSGLQDAIGDSLNAYPIDISKYVPLSPTKDFYIYMEDIISSNNLDNLIIEVIGITDKTQETVQVEVMDSSEVYSY